MSLRKLSCALLYWKFSIGSKWFVYRLVSRYECYLGFSKICSTFLVLLRTWPWHYSSISSVNLQGKGTLQTCLKNQHCRRGKNIVLARAAGLLAGVFSPVPSALTMFIGGLIGYEIKRTRLGGKWDSYKIDIAICLILGSAIVIVFSTALLMLSRGSWVLPY